MVVGDIATGTDVVVIGAGPGGYTAAIKAAQKGKEVIIIDKEKIGGTCLNRGCIPAKAFIHASKYKYDLERWNEIGIETDLEEIDFKKVQEWKQGIVNRLNKGVKTILNHENVEFVKGEATFIDSNTVRVEEEHNAEKIEFNKGIIATGSQPVEIPGMEFNKEKKILSSRELLNLEEVPDEIIVVGGGYIGMEAVTKFAKFGSKVKIVEATPRVLQNFDQEIVSTLQEVNPHYGNEIHTSTKAKDVRYENDKIILEADRNGKKVEIEGDYMLVAVGRTAEPALDNLGLENTSVTRENGFIEVDNQMKTNDESILAIGDCIGNPMLAHKAYMEGRVAGKVASGENAAFDNQYIPKVMYTDPEVAVVGMTPEEAKQEYGEEVMIGEFPFTASGRALTTNKPEGFVKVVACPKEKLLGVQIVGSRASDMIAEATLALEMQGYLDDVINTIHAHPTFPEAFAEACEDAKNESIHTF